MSSPQTPRHSPHPSVDIQYSSFSPPSQQGRRQSKASSFNESTMDMPVSGAGLPGSSGDGGGGLGNLADELAGAFSEGEDDEEYGDEDGGSVDGGDDGAGASAGAGVDGTPGISLEGAEDPAVAAAAAAAAAAGAGAAGKEGGVRDSGVDVESPRGGSRAGRGAQSHHQHRGSLGLPAANGHGRGHHRRVGSEYDGSEYGSESDLETAGIPPRLLERMDEVESLARRGTENNGSAADGAFKRVTEGAEGSGLAGWRGGGATRLITAHSALTSHLAHQTRQLHNLTFPLLSPLAAPPDPDAVDSLLPMLVSLSDHMPRPATGALQSLASLHALTADLVHTLNYLSDTLHMSRQTTTTAARRLKGARDLVAELRRDEELREQGERWLARGGWGERLRRRECALVCGEVVGGFEKVCDSWRERLLALAESSQA